MISPDLKVRHKDSGYEYTIDKVEGEEGDEVKIYLRSPESPRVEPAPEEKSLLGEPRQEEILGEEDEDTSSPGSADPEADDDEQTVFVIDQDEFEKEYEVD